MNTGPNKLESAGQSLLGILMVVFLALAIDGGFRLYDLLRQRGQLDQARLEQTRSLGQLAQGQQAQTRLQLLCLDLLGVAATNAAARQIVQEFNIEGSPAPRTVPPSVSATNITLLAPSNALPASSNPPAAR